MSGRLTVSNIAWSSEEDGEIARALERLDVTNVEIAPTKVFDDPTNASDAEVARCLDFWADHGVAVVAFQSMLFGREDLTLFHGRDIRTQTVTRLKRFIELAGRMNVGVLVFGSPKNRQIADGKTESDVWEVAIDIFAELGAAAIDAGTVFCIEPNPPQYGCNFVTTSDVGAQLVRDVNSAGFALHLDAAGMTLAGEAPDRAIRSTAGELRHYHVSAPHLAAIEDKEVDHISAFRALREIAYQGHVSIEMRPGSRSNVDRVTRSVDLVRRAADRAEFAV